MTTQPGNPAVARFVDAINAGDRDAFFANLTDDATKSDDGTARNLRDWAEREIFDSGGRMTVEEESDSGRTLVAVYSNSVCGEMRTRWAFTVRGDRVSRFETGQA